MRSVQDFLHRTCPSLSTRQGPFDRGSRCKRSNHIWPSSDISQSRRAVSIPFPYILGIDSSAAFTLCILDQVFAKDYFVSVILRYRQCMWAPTCRASFSLTKIGFSLPQSGFFWGGGGRYAFSAAHSAPSILDQGLYILACIRFETAICSEESPTSLLFLEQGLDGSLRCVDS